MILSCFRQRVRGRYAVRMLALLASLILFVAMFGACAAKDQSSNLSKAEQGDPGSGAYGSDGSGLGAVKQNAAVSEESRDSASGNSSGNTANGSAANGGTSMEGAAQKIIRNASVSIETQQFDKALASVQGLADTYSGFIENSTVQGGATATAGSSEKQSKRSATLVLRIPSQHFDTVMNDLAMVETVVREARTGTDITSEYMDLEARKKSLEVQETRLLELIAKAATIENIITLESKLSETRYSIESIQNKLTNYDRLVAYSRITVSITETARVTSTGPLPVTFGARAVEALKSMLRSTKEALEDFIIWLIRALPSLILLGGIALLVYFVTKKVRMNRRQQNKPMD